MIKTKIETTKPIPIEYIKSKDNIAISLSIIEGNGINAY